MVFLKERPSKRIRVTADLYDFLTFPAADVSDVPKPFRSNIRAFLASHALLISTPAPTLFPYLTAWQTPFRVCQEEEEDAAATTSVVTLYVVEEDVTRSSSRSVYCNHCQVAGWGKHPVCGKRYHFIVRSENSSSPGCGYDKLCGSCGNLMHLSDSRCSTCNSLIVEDNLEDWLCLLLDDTSHLLHGVIHSNGYGHLLILNGREGGSNLLSGCNIMNFWDRLCQALAARKITVMDVSKKYGMDYRLLYAITNGHSWYGNWGYEFGTGSYALTSDAYQEAVKTLSSMPLSLFTYQRRRPRTHLQDIISFYQSISDFKLATARDLFSFILRLIRETDMSFKSGTCKNSSSNTRNTSGAWTRNDIEQVEHAMFKILQAAAIDSRWVSRYALKGALCKNVSPELLDYYLKNLGGKIATNGMFVNTKYNATSKAIEFRLQPLERPRKEIGSNLKYPSKEHMIHDLKFLYDSILDPQKMVPYGPQSMRELASDSATKLLDCKQFVKDYKPDKMPAANPLVVCVWCHVELADEPKDTTVPPPELLILPENASIADLKLEANKAFQEVYAMFKKFETDEMLDYGPLENSMTLKLLVGTKGSVRVRGKCYGTYGLGRFRMERGTETWTVHCICGAKDDDGERMLACDTCGVWQHTRCVGIDNQDAVPEAFMCKRCESPRVHEAKPLPGKFRIIIPSRTCRDYTVSPNSLSQRSASALTLGVR